MSTLRRESWADLVPHAGTMALLDAVTHWDETDIHAIGERLTPADHPLYGTDGLHAIHLAEYGAQATAVHAAQLGETGARAGRLVSLRDVRLAAEYVDLSDGCLEVHAKRLHGDERGAQYAFNVAQQGRELASGRVLVMYVE